MRFLAAAATPLKISWIIQSLLKHINGNGRAEFEEALKKYFNKTSVYTFTSLMRTNYACLLALKLSTHGDKKRIILPRYSCPSFIHAILASELEPVYCDINPETLSIDINSLERIDTKNVLAIICTNLFGLSSKVEEIRNFCNKHDIYMIEGVDYGIGSKYDKKLIGTESDFTILNFQEGKAIPIGGGAVITNHESIMNLLNISGNTHSTKIFTLIAYRFAIMPFFYWLFMKIVIFLGFNRKKLSMEDTIRNTSKEFDFSFEPPSVFTSISNFQASLGLIVLNNLESFIEARKINAYKIEEELMNIGYIKLIKREEKLDIVHYIRYPILVDPELRESVLKELLEKGIEASPMYVEHGMNINPLEFPGSYKVLSEILTLPCHPYVNTKDILKMSKIINNFSSCKSLCMEE